jgi:hypothetical protein
VANRGDGDGLAQADDRAAYDRAQQLAGKVAGERSGDAHGVGLSVAGAPSRDLVFLRIRADLALRKLARIGDPFLTPKRAAPVARRPQ